MKLPNTTVYRGGASQNLIYAKPFEVNLDNGKAKTLDVRFRTNPNGNRRSSFCVEIGFGAYPVLLEHIADSIAADHPAFSAILKAIALALSKSYLQNAASNQSG
jgi:hypothetical protein